MDEQLGQETREAMRRTILVVDDFDEYRVTLKLYLERSGYFVVEAEDGRQAVRVARETLPAVILMDIGLPQFGGLAAIRDIREDRVLCECPIVVVTAYATPGLHQEALDVGADEVLEKPVDFEHLITVLQRFAK